jgi:hypothetical protein
MFHPWRRRAPGRCRQPGRGDEEASPVLAWQQHVSRETSLHHFIGQRRTLSASLMLLLLCPCKSFLHNSLCMCWLGHSALPLVTDISGGYLRQDLGAVRVAPSIDMELPQATYGPWSRCAVSLLVRWRTGVPRERYTATTIQSALAAVHDAGIFKSETTVRHQEKQGTDCEHRGGVTI